MKRLAIPVVVIALLGAFTFWWFSPLQIVKRRTRTMLETLALEAGSGRSGRQMGVYSLNALLAPEVELKSADIDRANGVFERSEIESAFSWLCDQAKQTRFDLKDFRSVKITGDRADVAFSAEVLVELPNSRPADGFYQVEFRWLREDETWRLSRAVWTVVPP
jgi:hypothetical protein